jgi:hypothetical protein
MYLRQRQKVGPCRLGLVVGIVSAWEHMGLEI